MNVGRNAKRLMFGPCVVLAVVLLNNVPEIAATGSSRKVAQDVGYIEALHGHIDAFTIERQGQPVTPAILLPLRAGDRLIVRGMENGLWVQCGNQRVTVTEQDSPYLVPVPKSPPGFLARLSSVLVAAGKRLTEQHARSIATVSTSSRGQDGPLLIPLLDHQRSQLLSGPHTLYLAWQGGVAPYGVLVSFHGNEPRELAHADQVDDQHIGLTTRNSLPLGFVHIEVRDSAGHTVEAAVKIVSLDSLPPIPKDLGEGTVPAPLQSLLVADWLAQQGRREWRFQAYQMVAPLATSFTPAGLLRDCLEEPSCYDR